MACEPNPYVSAAYSRWVAAWNPVPYRANSNKWPINIFDPVETVSSITDQNGKATVNIASTVMAYQKGESITLSGMSSAYYNGVFQITKVISTTSLVIRLAYNGTATGSIQKYYQNYNAVANVYTGFPAGHALHGLYPGKDIALAGTEYVSPDTSGNVIIDVAPYLRRWLSPIENDFCGDLARRSASGFDAPNFSGFCPFYIELAESYDIPNGDSIITYTSPFLPDYTDNGVTINYQYGVLSAKQFGQINGRSMGDYVCEVQAPQILAKWLTMFERPVYWSGYPFDLSIINGEVDIYLNGNTLYDVTTRNSLIRISLDDFPGTIPQNFYIRSDVAPAGEALSETITVEQRTDCGPDSIYLQWLNPLGGWDNWLFTGEPDKAVEITAKPEIRRDIYQSDRYFQNGITQDDVYAVDAYTRRTVRSQFLSDSELEAVRYVLISPKVYHIYTENETGCDIRRYRTVLIDPGTFTYKAAGNDLNTITFSFRYTDPIIVQGQ